MTSGGTIMKEFSAPLLEKAGFIRLFCKKPRILADTTEGRG